MRGSLEDAGWNPVELAPPNRSTIVSVSLRGAEPGPLLARLKRSGVTCVARDGNLRMSIHFYNHEDDIDHLTRVLVER